MSARPIPADDALLRGHPGARRTLLGLAGLVVLMLASELVLQNQPDSPSVQTRNNLRVAMQPTLQDALEAHSPVWAPLYPLLIWAVATTGLPLWLPDHLALFATLAWLAWFARARLPGVHFFWPPALYAVASFTYVNLRQRVSEHLVIVLALVAVSMLDRYLERRSWPLLATLGILAGVLGLTKYLAVFWLFPLMGAAVLWANRERLGTAVAHAAAFAALAVAPLAGWLALVKHRTGFISGMDRLTAQSYSNRPEWAEATGFGDNLAAVVKTPWIDFFSWKRLFANHKAVVGNYDLSVVEIGILGLMAAVLVLSAVALRSRAAWRSGDERTARTALLLASSIAALVTAVLVIWTIGNNDPIYSRILYPGYAFLVALAFLAYHELKRIGAGPACLVAWRALLAVAMLVNVHRTYRTMTL